MIYVQGNQEYQIMLRKASSSDVIRLLKDTSCLHIVKCQRMCGRLLVIYTPLNSQWLAVVSTNCRSVIRIRCVGQSRFQPHRHTLRCNKNKTTYRDVHACTTDTQKQVHRGPHIIYIPCVSAR